MKRRTQILLLRGIITALALLARPFWFVAALRFQLTTRLNNLKAARNE